MESRDTIFKNIFQRDLREAGTSDWLEDVITRYPGFAPALFFKLQQGKWNHPTQLLDQCQVLFPNAHWLQYSLKHKTEGQYTENLPDLPLVEPDTTPELTEETNTENQAAEPVPANEAATVTVERVTPEIDEEAVPFESAADLNAPVDETRETVDDDSASEVVPESNPEEIQLPVPEEGGIAGIAGLLKTEAVVPDAGLPLFEPLHTTDYFASQGIKISEEVLAADRLGHQLKSFTQWLKAMKKLHPNQLAAAGESSDKNIQQLAEESNTAGEVLTEAMAQILIQQGRTDKAIEVYEKLSLQNPAKSGFFATQIENLKAQ